MNKKRFSYSYVMVGLCFLTIFISLGFCRGNRGLFLAPITDALGISRSVYSFNDTICYITSAVMNLFLFRLCNRFGLKRMIVTGLGLTLIAFLVSAIANTVFPFYVSGFLMGMGSSFTTTGMMNIVLRRWVKKNLGTALGLTLAANGLGSTVAALIYSPVISASTFGYRTAYYISAALTVLILVIVLLFFREAPKDYVKTDTEMKKKSFRMDRSAISGSFILVCIMTTLTGVILQGMVSTRFAHWKDNGLSTAWVTTLAAISGLLLTSAKFLAGLSYDKLGLRKTLFLTFGASVLALVTLCFSGNSTLGIIATVIGCICYPLALPLETVLVPLISGDLFGAENPSYANILLSVLSVGFSISGPVFNVCFDLFSSYNPIYFISAILMAGIALVYIKLLKLKTYEKEVL